MTDTTGKKPAHLFKECANFKEGNDHPSHGLISRTLDITLGAKLALEMIERDEITAEDGDAPMLGVFHRSVLLRMVISSLDALSREADNFIFSSNCRASKSAMPSAKKNDEAKHA